MSDHVVIFAPETPPYVTTNKVRLQEIDESGEPVEKANSYCDKLYLSKKALQRMKYKDGSRIKVQFTVES